MSLALAVELSEGTNGTVTKELGFWGWERLCKEHLALSKSFIKKIFGVTKFREKPKNKSDFFRKALLTANPKGAQKTDHGQHSTWQSTNEKRKNASNY